MTVSPLEKELESFNPKFEEYDELTANGNYLQAREIVISLAAKGERLVYRLFMKYHRYLTELQNKIPASCGNYGMELKKWKTNPIICNILNCQRQIEISKEKSKRCWLKWPNLKLNAVQQQTNEINERIDSFYDALEKEVNAKHYVDEHYIHDC